MRVRFALAILVMAAATGVGAVDTGIAGREAFPGVSLGRYTVGATFAGWTSVDSADRSNWVPIGETSGESWSASIVYVGNARVPGQSVAIVDGLWTLGRGDEPLGGRVLTGQVRWPPEQDVPPAWPCWSSTTYTADYYPVAVVDAVLVGDGAAQGRITGCLDDIRWDPDLPLTDIPRIWGVLSVGGVLGTARASE